MTHQTLISSAPAFSPASHSLHASTPLLFTRSSPSSSSCSPPAAAAAPAMASFVAHHHGSLVEREGRMAALRSSLRPCEAAEEVDVAPAACGAADRGAGLFGDGFSVEDLLDLEDLCEVDKDCAELGEATPAPAAVEEDKLSSDSHGSSVVSYELMALPPPVIDLSLPAHDAEELEWVSRIMDDSLAELPPPPKLPAAPLAAAARRPPLERAVPAPAAPAPMRSPTICALSTEALVPVKARRSKRSRASVWSLSGGAPPSDSTSSSSTTTTSSCSSSASFSSFLFLPAESPPPFWAAHLLGEAPPRGSKKSKHGKHGKNNGKPKKRGRKPKHHPAASHFAGGAAASPPVPGDRRCSHCGVQKTPQWRAGPEGAKTLCNACGVRYKSGRLLPEYRPACSPTFVSSIHSNSHRKVLEMRRKKEGVVLIPGPAPLPAAAPAVASF
ncbi:hypothetical protein SEVIR_1G257100v4 [Setaria viridis]|uniref:GATA-type domain-containing protein n=1 Tax=Setaria viridis TaxID=4556 RepID=A0A4U6WPF9_SETVI|nr:GATA transcription factor 5-like [Setaria viridis]TKW40607.1 hypothetical protein SEVIR_1G257100v2 [Setaria viridis]